jgi:Mn-dependent DtxR family transcriptional regulator
MTKRGIDTKIFKLIKASSRPVSTREISKKLNIAWHTADRYCLKLQIKQKVDSFTIGKATAWFIKK